MKILMFSRRMFPHVGGVEKHVREVGKQLIKKGYEVVVLTEQYDQKLKSSEKVDGIIVRRFRYPRVKFLGLIWIWVWLLKNRKLIISSELVHIHDVFIWYLPLRFIYPRKRIYMTFHGWEGVYPLPWWSKFQKRLAAKLCDGNVCVGEYIEKYFGIKANLITYGGVEKPRGRLVKDKKLALFVGRLAKDTGLLVMLKKIDRLREQGYRVVFCGDGELRSECARRGEVLGFVDPWPYLRKAKICLASGYLSALEGLVCGCEVIYGYTDPLKKDYWGLSPFSKANRYGWARKQTWEKLADEYLKLYNCLI